MPNDQIIVSSADFDTELVRVQYLQITKDEAGQRLDNFLFRILKKVPKSRIYNLLRRGEVRVNKARKKAEYKLEPDDIVRLPPVNVQQSQVLDTQTVKATALVEKLKSSVIFEDTRLLILNKPAGLAVHGGSGVNQGLIEVVRYHFPHAKQWELVHRLDRETSGLIMIAKRRAELRRLHEAFRANQVQKTYWAILNGHLKDDCVTVNAPLKKNLLSGGARIVKVDPQGQPAQTHFHVKGRMPGYTWVQAEPVTGRTHQIRVHAQSLGCSIAGDDKYADHHDLNRARQRGYSGLMLHAYQLKLPMVDASELCIIAQPPSNLSSWLAEFDSFVTG